jgi:hypothetical protein
VQLQFVLLILSTNNCFPTEKWRKTFPKDTWECETWIKVIEAEEGASVIGVSKDKKYRLPTNFYVAHVKGQRILMDTETKLPVFIADQFDQLWETYHVRHNHPCDVSQCDVSRINPSTLRFKNKHLL